MLGNTEISYLKVLIFLGMITLTYGINAQDVIDITLDEAIEKALNQNLDIRLSEQEVLISRSDVQSAKVANLPNINLSYTGITTNNPLMAFGSKLNQERISESDFNPAFLNDPSRIENFTTRLEIQQPIIKLDTKHHIRASEAKTSATEYQSLRTKDQIGFEVEKAYLQLQLSYKALDVLGKSKLTAEENYRIAQNNYDQGYLPKADLLSAGVRISEIENQILNTYTSIDNLSNLILLLMGENTYRRLKPSEELKILSAEILQDEIPENRPDLLAMQKVSEAYASMYKANKKSTLPRLNGFASYALHDDGLFQGQGEGYLIGLSLSWNLLGQKKNHGNVQKSKAEYEISRLKYQQYLNHNQTELNKVQRMLIDARQKITLAEQSLEQSRESLRIRSNRYEQGLEKTTDLLMAETMYAQKELDYYSAIYDHNQAILHIKFLTKN